VTLVVPNAAVRLFFGTLPLQEMKFLQFAEELPDSTCRWRRSAANFEEGAYEFNRERRSNLAAHKRLIVLHAPPALSPPLSAERSE